MSDVKFSASDERAAGSRVPSSPQPDYRRCGYCHIWATKPCGEQCCWSPDGETVEDAKRAAALVAGPQQQEKEDDQSRVGPSVPCVAPTGSTAEPSPDAVTVAERTETIVLELRELGYPLPHSPIKPSAALVAGQTPPARLLEFARMGAIQEHNYHTEGIETLDSGGHRGRFDVCLHEDCVLVRAAGVGSSRRHQSDE